jgi:integrase
MSDLKLIKRGKIYHVHGTIKVPGQKVGIRVRESTGHARLRDAEDYRDKLRKEVLERAVNGPAATATFSTAVIMYVEKGGEKRFLKPLLERFGTLRLRDVTSDKVTALALEKYSHLSPASVKRQLYTPINAVMSKACKGLGIPVIAFEPPKVERTTVVHAPEEWFPPFFKAAHFRIAAMVLFLTTTGARVGEACRLTVEDCHLEKLRVLLRKTKNGKPRMVPISETIAAAIQKFIDLDNLQPEDTVFGYADRWSVNQAIARVCAKAGLKYYSSHKLGRHAFASRLLMSGRTLKEVQEAGGWDSFAIVAEVYGHLEEKAVEALVRGKGSEVSALLADTSLTHATNGQNRKNKRNSVKSLKNQVKSAVRMVGTRGIEPLTPTMSRVTPPDADNRKPPKNKDKFEGDDAGSQRERVANAQATEPEG